jgi:hypothetical protein
MPLLPFKTMNKEMADQEQQNCYKDKYGDLNDNLFLHISCFQAIKNYSATGLLAAPNITNNSAT